MKHKHSLIELAYKPKLMNEATLNADGFGLAWKNKESFKLYKNYLPIWNDLNLDSLSKSISSNLVIGNVGVLLYLKIKDILIHTHLT